MITFNSLDYLIVNALKIILVLGFLIFIHELGHFIFAKIIGVKVHEFALGFGKKLISFAKGETTYSIRLLPLGGFVKMEGEDEYSEDERAFNKKPVGARLIIVLAGPLMNILFGLILLFILNIAVGGYVSNYIEKVLPGSAAEKAGLLKGDKVIKINDKMIRIKDDINWVMGHNNGEEVKLTIVRDGKVRDYNIQPFMELNFEVNSSNVVTKIEEGSGLFELGLKIGDKIRSINGIQINSPVQMKEVIRNSKTNKLVFEIERNNTIIQKSFKPIFIRRFVIGFLSQPVVGDLRGLIYYSFWKSMFLLKVIFIGTANVLTGGVSINEIMGPVGIAKEITARNHFFDLLSFTAYISLSLGVVNLIPFPPLDGSKILTLGIEVIRRKPINPQSEMAINIVGFSLLIILLMIVTFNDIGKFLMGR